MALEERVARLEGIIEQMNERLQGIEAELRSIRAELRSKADKGEVRLLFGMIVTLQAAMLALLGVILTKI